MIDSLLLTATRVVTCDDDVPLTNATGFFFERDDRLFLVTSRHVMHDEPSNHKPDGLQIELHVDVDNMAESTGFSIPLYVDGKSAWRQGVDAAGEIDVAVIEIDRAALPETAVYHAFTPQHLLADDAHVEVGSSLLIVGFPLGFHDTLHHMPVVRQAVNASSFGLRFQGKATSSPTRAHIAAPVAPRWCCVRTTNPIASADLPWILLGVHSARLDAGTRDVEVDEALGLNCAWYADILLTLTEA